MSSEPQTTGSKDVLDGLLNEHFAGKVVRKDLTKLVKEGANVPVYVLEYLLGMYCASDDENIIRDGLETVKRVLAENYVRPDEAEKVKSYVRERGSYKIIDKVTVTLNEKRDAYEALLSNLGTKGVQIPDGTVKEFEKLLAGGIWSIVTIQYFHDESQRTSPFYITDLKPIQMPNMDMEGLYEGRKAFTADQWLDVLLRSTGMEPSFLDQRVKWHLLARMIPFVENNYNACELGPRGTGKSHIYKEISPNSILVSGGQTTVANLFYNMASRLVGLVGFWDIVAFDEVAGIKFKDADGVQIMKDYMASGSFARGRDSINANASMVFVGNINQPVRTLVKTSHLLVPFPDQMIDGSLRRSVPRLHTGLGSPQDAARVLHEQIRSDRRLPGRISARDAKAKLRGYLGSPFQARELPESARHDRGAANGFRATEAALSARKVRQRGNSKVLGLRAGDPASCEGAIEKDRGRGVQGCRSELRRPGYQQGDCSPGPRVREPFPQRSRGRDRGGRGPERKEDAVRSGSHHGWWREREGRVQIVGQVEPKDSCQGLGARAGRSQDRCRLHERRRWNALDRRERRGRSGWTRGGFQAHAQAQPGWLHTLADPVSRGMHGQGSDHERCNLFRGHRGARRVPGRGATIG